MSRQAPGFSGRPTAQASRLICQRSKTDLPPKICYPSPPGLFNHVLSIKRRLQQQVDMLRALKTECNSNRIPNNSTVLYTGPHTLCFRFISWSPFCPRIVYPKATINTRNHLTSLPPPQQNLRSFARSAVSGRRRRRRKIPLSPVKKVATERDLFHSSGV